VSSEFLREDHLARKGLVGWARFGVDRPASGKAWGRPASGSILGEIARPEDDARNKREFIDYKTSMITDEDPLRGLLFY